MISRREFFRKSALVVAAAVGLGRRGAGVDVPLAPLMKDAPIRSIPVDELRTYHMDIRRVLSDSALKDLRTEADAKMIRAVNLWLDPSMG